jgi:hypothetical protein
MIALDAHRSHSADVTMSLLVNGDSFPVAQLGPDFLLLGVVADPAVAGPCDAVVKLRVDDVERQWSVRLPQGISPASRRVMLALFHGEH